jgi:hypothetical protein
MINPPIEKPRRRNDMYVVSPKYSGERNKKGTPKLTPKKPLITAKRKAQ